MKYVVLGNSGLKVSELCLGTMTFGEDWGWGASKEECGKMFDAFAEAGGNFIDTANRYTNGTSEVYTGELLAGRREQFVLATKYTLNSTPHDPNGGGNHRKSMVQSLEASLKRLKTDYIDLYWVHAWDRVTPLEEMMRALDDQVRAGKILYVGISDAPAWLIARANTLAELKGWTPFVGIQVLYNLADRTAERDLLPMAGYLGIGITAWSPLAGGVLTGKYNKTDSQPRRFSDENRSAFSFVNDRNLAIAGEIMAMAEEIDRTPSQVALRWLRQKSGNGQVIPIIGGRSGKQVADNLGCLFFELTDRQMERLDGISEISMGFPHDFLNLPSIAEMIHGKTKMID